MNQLISFFKSNPIFYLIIIVFFAFVWMLIISIIKTRNINKIKTEYSNIHFSKNLVVKIIKKGPKSQVIIYDHYRGMNRKIFNYNEYLNTIIVRDREKFSNFIDGLTKINEDSSISKQLIVRHCQGAIISNNKDFRREYTYISTSVNGTGLFLKMNELDLNDGKEDIIMLDFERFCFHVNSSIKPEKEIQGGILVMQIPSYEKIVSRYNSNTAGSYMAQLAHKLKTFCVSKSSRVAKVEEDKFLIFNSNLTNRRLAINFMQEIETFLLTPIKISSFKLNTEINFGFAFIGEFSFEIKKVIEQADKALDIAVMLPSIINVMIYDKSMEEESIKLNKGLDSTRRIIENNLFTPHYTPIIDIKNSKTYGYRVTVSPDSHLISFDDVQIYSEELGLETALHTSIAKTIFSHYYFKRGLTKRPIFIEVEFSNLGAYFNEFQSNTDYHDLDPYFVIKDYNLFYMDKVINQNLLENIKLAGCKLYLIAKYEMLTSNHLIFNYIQGIIFDKLFINTIEVKDVVKLEMQKINDRFNSYNYHYFVFDIDKYTKLEVVRSIGLEYLEGNWFGTPKTTPSEPETKSLKKINKNNE